MARDDPKFMLRMPAELKAQVEEAARTNNRSINAELVDRITKSFSDEPQELLTAVKRAEQSLAATSAVYAGVIEAVYNKLSAAFDGRLPPALQWLSEFRGVGGFSSDPELAKRPTPKIGLKKSDEE
jgi:hypothetical protein